MYYVVMPNKAGEIQLNRITTLMMRKGLDGKTLSEVSGVSEATISKLVNEKIGGTSAVNLGRIANALEVSVDYLLGYTDEPMPPNLSKDTLIIELVQLAQGLTNRRRRDLIDTARAYLESSADLRGNPSRLAADILDLITEAGGAPNRKRLLDYLESDIWAERGNELGSGLGPDEVDGPLDHNE